ncbi:hypothetical protein N9N67_02430 [Bacteriovoracaceae bacterium]|nr:hypothetical protein [Bacteriovoracaceae bacterium]
MKLINHLLFILVLSFSIISKSSSSPFFPIAEYITPPMEIQLKNYAASFKEAYYTVYLTNAYHRMSSKKVRRVFSILESGKVNHKYDGSVLEINSFTIPDYWFNEGLKPNHITVVFHKSAKHLLNTQPTRLSLEKNFRAAEIIMRDTPDDATKEETEEIEKHNQQMLTDDTPENRKYISRFTLPLIKEGQKVSVKEIVIYPQI